MSHAPPQLFPLNIPILKTIVFLGPLIIISVFVIVYIYLPDWYLLLVQEDGISEYTQAAAYFLASAFGVATALSLRKTKQKHIFWLFIMFTLGTLFMGFEEINWGQRIFGFNTPDIIKVKNIQSEFSVHNLEPVESNTPIVLVSIGLFGGLAWLFNTTKNATDWRRVILPEWYLSLYFISVSAFNVYRWYLLPPETRSLMDREIIGFWRHQELFELLLALGFLFVAICNYKKLTAPT